MRSSVAPCTRDPRKCRIVTGSSPWRRLGRILSSLHVACRARRSAQEPMDCASAGLAAGTDAVNRGVRVALDAAPRLVKLADGLT